MQTDTGHIFTPKQLKGMFGEAPLPPGFKEMKRPPTTRQMERRPPRVGKYDPCPCGSGKKFKWCCFTGQPHNPGI